MPLYAEESEQVKRSRRKLQNKLSEIDELITPEALARMSEEINIWISKNIKDRIDLKNKNISLFDENQNYARVTNRSIQKLRDALKEQIMEVNLQTKELLNRLHGRVQSNEES